MTDDLAIRPLTPSDRPEWARLWTAYLAFYETSLDAKIYDVAFERLLSKRDGEFQGRLALLGNRPVGLVHFLFHRHVWRVENVCYLQDLYVNEDSRGSGVGRALIETVYEAADTAGAPTVYWMTQHFNTSARQLYDRIGEETPFIKYQRTSA